MTRLIAAAIAALVLPLATASGADAAAEAETPTIRVVLDGPPADREAVDIALLLDGVDVTDAACSTVISSGLPELRCDALEAGTYELDVDDPRDGMEVDVSCTDLVANPIAPGAIPVTARIGDVECSILAGGPAILFLATDDDPFDPVLLDSDDAAVVCTDETLTIDDSPRAVLEHRRWCPTAPGTYRVDRDSIDPAFLDLFTCSDFAGPALDFDLPTGPFDPIVVGDEVGWLICIQGSFGPAAFFIDWTGPVDDPAAWFDVLELDLRDDDGNIVACDRVDEFSEPGNKATQFDCNVSAGRYTPALTGVPAGAEAMTLGGEPADTVTLCGTFDNRGGGEGRCAVTITTPNAPTPDGDVELPATGGGTTATLLGGFALLTIGSALLAGSRRRLS